MKFAALRQLGFATAIISVVAVAHAPRAGAVDAASPTLAAQKIATEPETRAAMDAIRRRVINVHTLITHRRLPVAGALQFAKETSADVARVAGVRAALDAKPDAMKPILDKIDAGAAAIAHPAPERGQVDGLVDVVSALEEYGSTFDHPGWQRLQQQ